MYHNLKMLYVNKMLLNNFTSYVLFVIIISVIVFPWELTQSREYLIHHFILNFNLVQHTENSR